MRRALVASVVREASVASSADTVDKEQMGEEKSVSLICSPLRSDHVDAGCKRSE